MSTPTDILTRVLPYSRYLSRLLDSQPDLADDMIAAQNEPVTAALLRSFLPAELTEDHLKPALRRLKQRAYARIATRDLAGLASLAEVTESMTLIAEAAVEAALTVHTRALEARFGVPRNANGEVQQLIVIGMGKLGGRELNVSSDIDLIFAYPEDGETDGSGSSPKTLSNFEFFSRLGRGIINAIDESTEAGRVFRVDMRLRPNGDSGPLVCCFEMLENYFFTQGREWERYAWIKARPLGGPLPGALDDSSHTLYSEAQWNALQTGLDAIRRPFVFRKYLDFGAINAMRDLHAQIRREVVRKDMANNVKLGPGGIREIEFIAQAFQLIRGGRDIPLQIKPTLQVLELLAERNQISLDVVLELTTAYNFLRRLEHRLQFLDDAQTHSLPRQPEDQLLIAQSMGFTCYDALLSELDDHRHSVSEHFEAVFADPNEATHTFDDVWLTCTDAMAFEPPIAADAAVPVHSESCSKATAHLSAHGYHDATAAVQRLSALRSGSRYQQLPESVRTRFDALVPRVIEACATTANPDAALTRTLDLLEAISRRAAYLSLLLQYPRALQKLTELAGASLWAATYLQHHPILLDELLDPRLLEIAPDWQAFRKQMITALDAAEPDTERQMDMLREAHHAQVFRLLAQDVSGLLALENLADHLSELADIMLELALQYAWRKLSKRHIETPRFTIISYGKLGGKELGYASDLDLVFLFEDAAPEAQEIYARLATRLNTWLSSQTSAGALFETDLRLRPNGDSGLIVTSLAAFHKYQREAAWMWEHQALTRARCSAGDRTIGAAFEQIRIEILRQPRDLAKLNEEVRTMRQKMRDAHATKPDQQAKTFDLKHDCGGLIDVEFIVQFLVLGYAHAYPQLTGNLGNLALLKMAGEIGLIPAELAETVRNAYRDYRRQQHALRLNNAPARVTPASVQDRVAAVRTLWNLVFDAAA